MSHFLLNFRAYLGVVPGAGIVYEGGIRGAPQVAGQVLGVNVLQEGGQKVFGTNLQ